MANKNTLTITVGGADFVVRSVAGQDRLGRLFNYELSLLSKTSGLDPTQLIGKTATVTMNMSGSPRYLNGIVNRFQMLEVVGSYTEYRMTLVPWLWMLSLYAGCRVFRDDSQKTLDIIKKIFTERGYSGQFEDRVKGDYAKHEFVVQYRETEFNFISRLLESEGIYYFFEHTQDQHKLVLADSPSSHDPYSSESGDLIAYTAETSNVTAQYQRIYSWSTDHDLRPANTALRDYDFTVPDKNLNAQKGGEQTQQLAPSSEIYDYPGGYTDLDRGNTIAKTRIEEIQSQYETFRGSCNVVALATGYTFQLTSHPVSSQNQGYLVIGSMFSATSPDPEANTQANAGDPYSCSFDADVATEQWRPPRVTPVPYICGPQTAVVVGKANSEIDTDEYGRVKVQFHWDRKGNNDENSSCWIRVAQMWAGKNWGATFTPRVGQEVVVEFLEGNPDHPIITGSVYNAKQHAPYLGKAPDPGLGLDPEHKNDPNVSGIKSCSTKGGKGYNEWRFDDTKGKEQIFIHGEKDVDTRVNNDVRTSVGNDSHTTVGGIDKFGNRYGDTKEKIFRDTFTHSMGNMSVWADQSHTMYVGKEGEATHMMDDRGWISLSADNWINLVSRGKIQLYATEGIGLRVGSNFITIDTTGIYINGSKVYINSGGSSIDGPKYLDVSFRPPPEPNPADDSKSGLPSAPPSNQSSGSSSSST